MCEHWSSSGLEHVDDRAVLTAHPPHDPADGVEVPQLPLDVPFQIEKLLPFGRQVVGQWPGLVVTGVDGRELSGSLLEKGPLDRLVPLNRIKNLHRSLHFDQPVGQRANGFTIGLGRNAHDMPHEP